MHKIVITGGPGAGKTEIMSHLTQRLEERGYKVIIVPEAATELILNGIAPSRNISMKNFQHFVLDLQLKQEYLFAEAAYYYDEQKVVMFCDRGVFDACAYVDMKPTFEAMLRERGLSIMDAYNRYDAVLHMVTAADGAEKYYQWNDPTKESVGNNAARRESPEEARVADKKTLNSWIGHPHLRVFDNSTDFEGKVKRVVDEVFALLGEPIPTEIERKFLIKKPTEDELKKLGCISVNKIVQTYLLSKDNSERRVRQRGTKDDGYSFYYTEKTKLGNGKRIENEKKISTSEYVSYLMEADTSLHQISKTRYCFIYNKRYFELDIYPFSEDHAILEIELNNVDEQVALPPLQIVKEVTDDPNYGNYALAKTLTLHHDCKDENGSITNYSSGKEVKMGKYLPQELVKKNYWYEDDKGNEFLYLGVAAQDDGTWSYPHAHIYLKGSVVRGHFKHVKTPLWAIPVEDILNRVASNGVRHYQFSTKPKKFIKEICMHVGEPLTGIVGIFDFE